MGNPAGVPRDFEALEKRRFQAIQMLERGLRQAEIARQLRVVPQTVARWMHDYRTHGKSALRKAGRAGRKPRLSEKQRQQLEKLLVAGPERIGYETPLWTCPRVAHLIDKEFDVRYHEGHVWKILVGLGWSPQRPEGRARERNEEQVLNWKKNVWPELKKSAPGEAYPRLHRRKRTESATASLPYLGTSRTDPHPAIQLQLEDSLGSCGAHVVEVLLSHLCRCHQERTGRRFSCGLGAPPWSTVADRVGSFAGTPQPTGAGVHCWFAGLDFHCLSSTLRAGTEPRRVHLGLLEAARVTQCLPQGLLATQRSSTTNAPSHAPPSATDHRLLAAIFFMARIALYYARVNSASGATVQFSRHCCLLHLSHILSTLF
jgi:transposase